MRPSLGSARDERGGSGLVLGQVARLAASVRAAADERACRTTKAASASAPIPILIGHGHGCAVTNPSIAPDDREREDQPDRDRGERAPGRGERLTACAPTRRDPGPEDVQTRRRGDEDAGELEQPVREG